MPIDTKTARHIAARIRQDLPATEGHVDASLRMLSDLFTSLVSARIDSGAPAGTGHDVLLHVQKAQEAMLSAAGQLARAHGKLLDQAREVGIGDTDGECPPQGMAPAEPLRLVG